MSNFVEQQNSNKLIYKRIYDKLVKIQKLILEDVNSLKELASKLPITLAVDEKVRLEKAVQNLDGRMKNYSQKLDKCETQLQDFKIVNSKFVKAYDNLGSQANVNAVINETAAFYVELEKLLTATKEMLADLGEIAEEFKKSANLETEKSKIKKVIKDALSEDAESIAAGLKKIFPTEDFMMLKLKESMNCVNGKCTIMESEFKKLLAAHEQEMQELKFKLDQVVNSIEMIVNENRRKETNLVNEIDNSKNELTRLRHDLIQRLKLFEQTLSTNVIRY